MTRPTEITAGEDALAAVLGDIVEQRAVSEESAERLRSAIDRRERLEQRMVDRIRDVHRRLPPGERLWIEFYVDALAGVFLCRRGDEILVANDREDDLIRTIAEHQPITDPGDRRLALRVLFRATRVSERFQRIVLDMVRHSLIHDERRLLIDLPRTPGTIDAVDFDLVRKLVYGAGGQYPRRISKALIEFFLSLDRTLSSTSLAELDAWEPFLLGAMTFHLTDHASSAGDVDREGADRLIMEMRNQPPGATTERLLDHIRAFMVEPMSRSRETEVHRP